ncbi:MAG: type II toxin-antitoxin system VapC family toxin [Chloroflexota bacterium]
MSRSVAQIPDNVGVMLDANIIVYALTPNARYHISCRQLLERGAKRKVKLHIVVNTAADVIHRAMVLELVSSGQFETSADAVRHLKQTQETVKQLHRYRTILGDLVQARINILPLTYRDLHASKQYRDDYGLMVNDSLIVAVMNREKIQHIATNDADFERIPNIAVRTPL